MKKFLYIIGVMFLAMQINASEQKVEDVKKTEEGTEMKWKAIGLCKALHEKVIDLEKDPEYISYLDNIGSDFCNLIEQKIAKADYVIKAVALKNYEDAYRETRKLRLELFEVLDYCSNASHNAVTDEAINEFYTKISDYINANKIETFKEKIATFNKTIVPAVQRYLDGIRLLPSAPGDFELITSRVHCIPRNINPEPSTWQTLKTWVATNSLVRDVHQRIASMMTTGAETSSTSPQTSNQENEPETNEE